MDITKSVISFFFHLFLSILYFTLLYFRMSWPDNDGWEKESDITFNATRAIVAAAEKATNTIKKRKIIIISDSEEEEAKQENSTNKCNLPEIIQKLLQKTHTKWQPQDSNFPELIQKLLQKKEPPIDSIFKNNIWKSKQEMFGSGGCTAYALAFLGILGQTLPIVKEKLNRCIDVVFLEFKNKNPNTPRKFAGIDNNQWHSNVICTALKNQYKTDFTFRKQKKIHFAHGKSYIVDGILNKHYFDPLYNEFCLQDDSENFDPNNPIWRHSIAILANNSKRGPFHFIGCRGLPGGFGSIDLLHLEPNGFEFCPNRSKGYMYIISKVYEICVPDMNKQPRSGEIVSGER